MFCESCNVEIPPAWVRAITQNICPACGEAIMSEASKQLLDELKEAMQKMPNDPEGLAGWLLSNYKLRKIGDAEPTEFHRKREVAQEEGIPNNLKIAEAPHHVFLERSGAAKTMANRKSLKDIANSINKAAIEAENPGSIEIDMDHIDENDYDEYEAVAAAQMAQAASSGLSAKKLLQNNSVVMAGDAPPPTTEEAQALAQVFGGGTQAFPGELPKALQVDRQKRLMQQHGVATGTGNGSFRRG